MQKTSRAVIFEDDLLSYGIGAEISATIGEGAFDFLDAPVRRVAAAEVPLPYSKPLERAAMPDAAALTRVIREILDATRFTVQPRSSTMSEVVMPRLSDTMEEGELAKWLKNVGDPVKKGESLAEIETDKATMDLEAFEDGVLEQQLVSEGTIVPIGQPVAVIGDGSGAKAACRARRSLPQSLQPSLQLRRARGCACARGGRAAAPADAAPAACQPSHASSGR